MTQRKNLHELEAQLEQLSAQEGLALIADLFPGKVTFSTSLGQEDQVITQLIANGNIPIQIFSLDTGRLFPETLDLLARTEAKYKQNIKVYYPNTSSVENLVSEIGINGFYDSVENRKSCCFVRKVEPLRRALAGNEVWVTGLRAEQSANRSDIIRCMIKALSALAVLLVLARLWKVKTPEQAAGGGKTRKKSVACMLSKTQDFRYKTLELQHS